MRIPPKPVPITYARFVWEATAAVDGKDIDEPNSPTRTRIQSIADAPCYHAKSGIISESENVNGT